MLLFRGFISVKQFYFRALSLICFENPSGLVVCEMPLTTRPAQIFTFMLVEMAAMLDFSSPC